MGVFRPFGGGGSGSGIPSDAIVVKADATGADSKGQRTGTIEPRHYGQLLAGEYATNSSIVGKETVVSKQGTATITISAGRVTFGAGTCWSFVLSNGSQYEFPEKVTSTRAIWYDTSASKRHLLMVSGSGLGDVNTLCSAGLIYGSDTLNTDGFSEGYENLMSLDIAPTAYVSVSKNVNSYGDVEFTATKITSGMYTAVVLSMEYSDLYAQNTNYSFIFSAKRPPSAENSEFEVTFNNGNNSNHSAAVISGPGTVSGAPGVIRVSGLDYSTPTVVKVTKTLKIGDDIRWGIKIYPGLLASNTIGHGVTISKVQVFRGSGSQPKYPGDGVYNVFNKKNIKSINGLDGDFSRIKYPITINNGTLFQTGTTYAMPEAPELIDLLGANSAWYNADGTAKTLTLAQFTAAINAASGWTVCANPDDPSKGIVIVDWDKGMLKALKLT